MVISVSVAAAGCASDGDGATEATSPATSESASTAVDTAPVDSTPDGTVPAGSVAATTAVDGTTALQVGLDDLAASGYHFVTIVTAGGSLAVQAAGDRVGDGSRFVLTRDDASVEYIATADGTWAMPAGGDWAAIDAPIATVDPISALGAATSVRVDSTDGQTTTIVATIPDSALGYQVGEELDVTITVVDGAITEVHYDTTVQGLAASVVTRLGPVADDAPVVAPI